ncbi:hypothetical protein VitviT2T_004888 [Vitis vinifera]|uniref:Reverse transcriptase Ty1/copia-type domain-containing protein n=1 Tax=Vitis vinifera TaxID=29760 RepID=A0ABY9BQV7_VITVI|nr:hypothetical protein VitviT2T_004888 [Vitis vinifera]
MITRSRNNIFKPKQFNLTTKHPRPNCVFHIKRNKNGNIAHYKARLVAKKFYQRSRIDYHEIFSPIVKLTTIRTVLSIYLAHGIC